MWAGAGDLGTGCHGGGGGGRDCSRQPQLLKLSASPAAPRCAAPRSTGVNFLHAARCFLVQRTQCRI